MANPQKQKSQDTQPGTQDFPATPRRKGGLSRGNRMPRGMGQFGGVSQRLSRGAATLSSRAWRGLMQQPYRGMQGRKKSRA